MHQQLPQAMTREDMLGSPQVTRPGAFGFKGRAFPLLSFILGVVGYLGTYLVAVSKSPPDVYPFPNTDLLHSAIHYPEYLIYRISMLVYPVVFCLSMQTLKNFLQIKSFEFRGQADPRLEYFGVFSFAAALLLCLSTASISDGGDLNYPLYFWGSRLYWFFCLVMIVRAAGVYRDLYFIKPFVPNWSYQFKSYSAIAAIVLAVASILDETEVLDLGYYPEWIISLAIVVYVGTLYWDLKDMDLLLRRK